MQMEKMATKKMDEKSKTFANLGLAEELASWYNKKMGYALISVREKISLPEQISNIWRKLELYEKI